MPGTAPSRASVLLGFRAENVRSFRDELEFSMLATRLSEAGVPRDVRWREGGRPLQVLPVAGIFGANASGKTNLLRAVHDMQRFVVGSFRQASPGARVPIEPFRLDDEYADAPSTFEIDLVLDDVRHEYGFTANRVEVIEEWAVHYPKGRSALLFHRRRLDVELGALGRAKGRAVRELLRPNALFLSTAASADHPVLRPVFDWFERNLLLADSDNRLARQLFSAHMLDDRERSDVVLGLLAAADLGIAGATRRELDPAFRERWRKAMRILVGTESEEAESDDDVSPEPGEFDVALQHHGAKGVVELDSAQESMGTLVWLGLVGPVIQALAIGSVLLVDELDASLHPALVAQIIGLFQDAESNPRRAQLIFNSHDVTLLGGGQEERLLGRDQLWFTEKRDDGSSRLFPLTDLDPRRDESIARRYLRGRYGAVPILTRPDFERAAALIASGERDP